MSTVNGGGMLCHLYAPFSAVIMASQTSMVISFELL